MHELTIARWILEVAEEEAQRHLAARVRRIACRVGCVRQIETEMLVEAFAVAARGGVCEGARLEIEAIGMELRCENCERSSTCLGWAFECPNCGSSQITLSGGDELEVVRLELEASDENRGAAEESSGGQRSGCATEPLVVE